MIFVDDVKSLEDERRILLVGVNNYLVDRSLQGRNEECILLMLL